MRTTSSFAVCSIVAIIAVSCQQTPSAPPTPEVNKFPIEGTWELLTGTIIQKGDTTVTDYTKGQKMLKIINGSHFAFLRHDLGKGKDSAIYDSGGGTWTLNNDQYTETLEYCSHRPWEGNSFSFKVTIQNDTFTMSGVEKIAELGVERLNIETYKRVAR